MNVKRLIIVGAATAGTGALVFGGTAVSTSFSSDANGNIAASAEHISIAAPEAQNLSLAGLRPGGQASTGVFHIDNTNGAAGELSLTNVGFQVSKNGSNDAGPNPSEITVVIQDTNPGAPTFTYNLNDLIGHNTTVTSYAAGYNEPFKVTFKLAQTAGNEWNGAQVNVPFTLHMEDSGASS